mgnify:CR=1 FL=1
MGCDPAKQLARALFVCLYVSNSRVSHNKKANKLLCFFFSENFLFFTPPSATIEGQLCQPCPLNYFKSGYQNVECFACADNEVTMTAGSIGQSDCFCDAWVKGVDYETHNIFCPSSLMKGCLIVILITIFEIFERYVQVKTHISYTTCHG